MESSPPQILWVPCGAGRSQPVILHDGIVTAPAVRQLREFVASPRHGFLAPAQHPDGGWGYLAVNGTWAMTPDLDDARSHADGLARFCRQGRWGYVDADGEIAIAPQYDDAQAFSEQLAGVRVGQNTWRFIDTSGAFAFDPSFFAVEKFSGGLAAVARSRQERKVGYIDRSGAWAIEPRFKSNRPFCAAGVAPASQDGNRYGLVDRSGAWILPPTYPDIRAFNNDGLAFFDEENSWDNGHGYLDTQGRVVLHGDRELSPHMTLGLAAAECHGQSYLRSDGSRLDAPRMSWSRGFDVHGCTVARSVDFLWSEQTQRHEPRIAQWGLLHHDGRFVALPADVLEPLVDGDGWVAAADTPLTPMLAVNTDVVWVDREAQTVWRACYGDNGVRLYAADGTLRWESSDATAPQPFFQRSPTAWLTDAGPMDNTAEWVAQRTAEIAQRLQRFAAGQPPTDSVEVGDDIEEDDGEDEDNDGTAEDQAARALCLNLRLARAYADEGHSGYYPFLAQLHSAGITALGELLQARLIAAFGPPDPDPDVEVDRYLYWQMNRAWSLPLAASAPADHAVWISLICGDDSGDGDTWSELRLVICPSRAALDAARRARKTLGGSATPIEPPRACAAEPAPPPPYPDSEAGWLAAIAQYPGAIAAVPAAQMNATLVNAALAGDLDVLRLLPAAWQSPELLLELVGRDRDTALAIPPQCMTAAALALARERYGDDPDWAWRDERRSQLPTTWEKNCLYDVWGGLLNETHALKAVRGGEALRDVPHWLRSEAVIAAALQADIYNISYLPPERITPALAERAVRHDYGKLIEHLPHHLLTRELCLESARTNGLSLEQIPLEWRSIDVCVAALADDSRAFLFVPPERREAVTTRLIERDLQRAKDEGEPRTASRWHGYRAWVRLWAGDWAGALADAQLAVERLRYPQHAWYVVARAQWALGDHAAAAAAASEVLSRQQPYTAEWNDHEDTTWLAALSQTQFRNLDEAALLQRLTEHPRTLADIPLADLSETLVAAALAADPAVIEYVPKRFYTPERYVLALQAGCKGYQHIPPAMLSAAACLEHVRDNGSRLAEIPAEFRTLEVCTAALVDTARALEHVPAELRPQAQAAAAAQATTASEDNETPSWLDRQTLGALLDDRTSPSRRKATWFAFVLKAALGARSDHPPQFRGITGWLEQRPVLLMLVGGLFAILALACHGYVSVRAGQLEGIWIGLLTLLLMGFAEVYWVWRAWFTEPLQWGLGLAACPVILYIFWFAPLKRRIGLAYRAREE